MTAREPGIDAAIAAIAAHQSDGLLAEAAKEARALARADLVEQLRAAIVNEALTALVTAATNKSDSHRDTDGATGTAKLAETGRATEHDLTAETSRDTRAVSPTDPAPAGTPGRGLYVYAIADVAGLNVAELPSGIGTGVTAIDRGDLAAVVSEIELARLENLSTADIDEGSDLAGLARAHDGVVRAVAEQVAVLPLRFATVVPDRDAVVRLLDDVRPAAARQLSVVRGCREFGVRMWQPESAAQNSTDHEPIDRKRTSGKEYLAKRRDALDAEAKHDQKLRGAVRKTDAALSGLARRRESRPAADGKVLSEFAYLVADEQQEAFLAEVDRSADSLDANDVRLQLTGPWPPYSFVQLDLAEKPVSDHA
jgi:hypothetical protein